MRCHPASYWPTRHCSNSNCARPTWRRTERPYLSCGSTALLPGVTCAINHFSACGNEVCWNPRPRTRPETSAYRYGEPSRPPTESTRSTQRRGRPLPRSTALHAPRSRSRTVHGQDARLNGDIVLPLRLISASFMLDSRPAKGHGSLGGAGRTGLMRRQRSPRVNDHELSERRSGDRDSR